MHTRHTPWHNVVADRGTEVPQYYSWSTLSWILLDKPHSLETRIICHNINVHRKNISGLIKVTAHPVTKNRALQRLISSMQQIINNVLHRLPMDKTEAWPIDITVQWLRTTWLINTHNNNTGFVQKVKYCFPGLSRTCKDQIPGFFRTHKTRFQRLSRINSVHKHGCIRSKKCTCQISYQCTCITVNKPKCNNWNSNRPKR